MTPRVHPSVLAHRQRAEGLVVAVIWPREIAAHVHWMLTGQPPRQLLALVKAP